MFTIYNELCSFGSRLHRIFCVNFSHVSGLNPFKHVRTNYPPTLEDIALRFEAIALRLEGIDLRLEAIALRLEAMPSFIYRLEAIDLWLEGIALRLEATALRLEAIALRLEAIALGLEAIALRLEAITLTLEAIALRLEAIALTLEAIALGLEAIALRLEAIYCIHTYMHAYIHTYICTSDCMFCHCIICITRFMERKQLTPFNNLYHNTCFMIASFASDDCTGMAQCRKPFCFQCKFYFAIAFNKQFLAFRVSKYPYYGGIVEY